MHGHQRSPRRIAARIWLALCLLSVLAPSAAPGASQRDRAGDVSAPGLKRSERKALDIRRVEVTTAGSGVVLVDVTLGGNFARAIGRGGLAKVGAGILLVPRRGRPSAVITSGRGSGERFAGRGRGTTFAALRDGNTIHFLVLGYPVAQLSRVHAATIPGPRPRRRRARGASNAGYFFARVFGLLEEEERNERATDQSARLHADSFRGRVPPPIPETCEGRRRLRAELAVLRNSVGANLERATGAGAADLQRVANGLDGEIAALDAGLAGCDGGATQPPGGGTGGGTGGGGGTARPGCGGRLTAVGGLPNEADFALSCTRSVMRPLAHAAQGALTALVLQVPGGRRITNWIDPPGTTCAIETRTSSEDSLRCVGPIPYDQELTGGRIQTDPAPSAGTGATLFVLEGATEHGPYAMTGP